MATTTSASSFNHADDEDYIDMEVSSSSSSSSNLFSHSSTSSPSQSREFEFQMSSSVSQERGEVTDPSPADELFYKGKLLPLHLPPRMQMVEKLCQKNTKQTAFEEAHYITISTTPCTSTNTPLASCNISPSESCRVSSELNPDDYLFEWSTELRGFISDHPKKSWSKKLKQIKYSSFSQRLKASRAYLKSLFSKSGCSADQSCAKTAACNEEEAGQASNGDKDFLNKYMIEVTNKKNPIEQIGKGKYPTLAHVIKSIEKEEVDTESTSIIVNNISHRKSFSGAIKRHSSKNKGSLSSSSSSSSSNASSSSSSFSFNSSGFYELQLFNRSSSASSELEGSIEAAIAHCKNSQQIFSSTTIALKDASGFCSQSASCAAPSKDQDSREAKCF